MTSLKTILKRVPRTSNRPLPLPMCDSYLFWTSIFRKNIHFPTVFAYENNRKSMKNQWKIEKVMILRQKNIHRKKKVFQKKIFFLENSIRATQDAIAHSYRPLGHGERFWANLDFGRSHVQFVTTKGNIDCRPIGKISGFHDRVASCFWCHLRERGRNYGSGG